MLGKLIIRNIALIDQLDIAFENGFSVLTGETGAGKSIIIEALSFVLGERATRELIQSGAQKASVEGTFALLPGDAANAVLERNDLLPEDGELVLYREMSVSGKSACRVNGTLVSAATLKEIGDALVDIHGQHAHQSLLNPKLHIDMLDAFAHAETAPVKKRVADAYLRASEARKQLSGAEMDERDRARRCDLLAYQIQEIAEANLTEGEEEELQAQRELLRNAQTVMESLEQASDAISGEEKALSTLSSAMRALDAIAPLHAEYADAAEKLRDLYYNLEDVSFTIRDMRSSFSYEPDSLNDIEWRLETISTLKRKYGASVAEVLRYLDASKTELEELQNFEERRETLKAVYGEALAAYSAAAAELTKAREQAAERLRVRIEPELRDLDMPHAAFAVSIERLGGELPGPSGTDSVEFLLSTNAGEPVKPLSRVASGGEISRIMLAFKSVLANADNMPTMVFDEIDTGISGPVGARIAVKMRQIARGRQVLCITHLPQIAAYANQQYYVFKREEDGRTRSSVKRLSESERVAEIARIMGSAATDAVAMQHARQLIETAQAAEDD